MQQRFEIGSKVYSAQYGAGEVLAVEGMGDAEKLTVRFDRAGERQVMTAFSMIEPQSDPRSGDTVGRAVPASPALTTDLLKEALREVLREELGPREVKMLDRWKGGILVMRPSREGQKEKEIPLDDFFHKIIMVRDRLRVLEQKLNSHPGLSAAEKVELHQYITRIYGSLTTFNVLFADREDWFVGQKGD